jgi:hypothetical protein
MARTGGSSLCRRGPARTGGALIRAGPVARIAETRRSDAPLTTPERADRGIERMLPGTMFGTHQRKAFSVKPLAGASSVVSPCIAVMGLVPAAHNRVDLTTDGAAHDERRGNRGSSMPRGARPDRQLDEPPCSVQAAIGIRWCLVPWVAMIGSHLRPVVMTAYSCRRIAAAMTA